MIDIPLDEKSFMFDTPGIIQSHQMTNYVSENELKIIIPKNEIKQRVYQLNENRHYFSEDWHALIMYLVVKDHLFVSFQMI